MIRTLSLCPVCYKKIAAFIYVKDGQAWMKKECDRHGEFESIVERSWKHFSSFYRYGSTGNNNSIIVHIENGCNMNCSWCYYGDEIIHDQDFYDQLLYEPYKGYSLMYSGGEPTIKPNYIDFIKSSHERGWKPSTITNMIKLADPEFFKNTLNPAFVDADGNYKFALSFQHPKNYGPEIFELKSQALANIEAAGIKAACVMFSIQSLDELEWIKEFYDKSRHLYQMLRIRTMFNNWNNKGEQTLFQSDLYDKFIELWSYYTPVQCSRIEQSTSYGMYLETKEYRDISIMSSPTVFNVDYHLCSRPVFMLAKDYRCYPVPIAQMINEGIGQGWKDGYQILAKEG